MIGTNIPGTTSFYLNKQKTPTIGSGPTAPTGTSTPAPSPATTSPTPQPQMAGYINTMAAKPPTPSPTPIWNSYQPKVAAQPQTVIQQPGPVASSTPTYTPPTPAPTTPQAPVTPYPTPSGAPAPKAGTPGSTLQDPGQITDAGKAYAQRVTQNLQPGQNPLVQNAQATEDTAAARRGYEANKGTQEQLAQTPFAVGSAQYQRAMDQSRSGVNAANLAGQNSVNDFTRKTTADNMAAAKGLEDTGYGNAVGERTRTDAQSQNYANTLPEGPARYAYQRMVASGIDPKQALDTIVSQTGQVNESYRGQTPGTLEVQGSQDSAKAWVGATTDLQPGTAAYTDAVRKRMQAVDSATQAPLNNGVDSVASKAIQGKLNNGENLTADETTAAIKSGVIPPLSAQTVPVGAEGVQAFKKQNPSGKFALDGEAYTIVQGGTERTSYSRGSSNPFDNGNARHTDYVEVKNSKGQTKYIYNGAVNDAAPVQV